MTGTVHVTWHVAPLSPPQALRKCSTCGRPRPFRSSGKVRLNANGRRLDAWLIYKCTACDGTWNLPLLVRVPVAQVPPADLSAMQTSDPDWVQSRAFDMMALRRHCPPVILPTDLAVTKQQQDGAIDDWSRIALSIRATWPTGQRLDRLLASELRLSRSFLAALQATGGLCVAAGSRQTLKVPLVGTVLLQFDAGPIAESARFALAAAFGLPPPSGSFDTCRQER